MVISILIAGWFVYLALHSVLASLSVKAWMSRVMGPYYKYYRVLYVVIATIGLLLMLYLNASTPSEDLINRHGLVRYLSLVFAAFGVIIFKVAFRSYRFSSFVGIKEEEEKVFIRTGILASIRHPIYLATILLVIGFWLYSPNLTTLVSVLCILVYLPIGIWLEEKKLVKLFGERYIEYKREVPAIFPRLW